MIIRSPFPDVDIPDVTLPEFVLRDAAAFGEKAAIICGATERSYSYRALADAVRRVSAGLYARGVGKGQVVGIVSPNLPEFAIAFFAITSIGAICSTVNPIATAEEIGAQFADSEACLIITIPALVEKCEVASRLASTVRELIVIGEAESAVPFKALLTAGNVAPPVQIDAKVDVAVLPYSSGTSGIPKGVMLTHRNIVANLVQMRETSRMVVESDRVLAVLPFFHIYGMVVIMCGALLEGATLVTLPRFDFEQMLSLMERHRITWANVVPPIVLALAKHPAVDTYDLTSLRALLSGAAPLSEELALACEHRLGITVRQGYGLTETSPTTHFHPYDHFPAKPGSVGPVIASTECRVIDVDTGQDVVPGNRGELWIRGPQVMAGYFNKPEATADCLTPDGWFKTGDIALADESGWFTIVDRVKELIKYKGLQVAPAELEAVLLSHEAVADAAVIPVPDAEAGEVPKAFIVLKADVSADAVMAYVASRVSPYKKVRVVEVVDSIPKSPSGKILRRVLVERERTAAKSAVS